MARPGAKDTFSFLFEQGLVVCVLGFYLPIIHGAYGAEHSEKAAPISRLILTVETPDGVRYAYTASPSIAAVSLERPPAPAPEGWLQSVSRNLAVGIIVPVVLLGVSEVFAWVKKRYRHRAAKEQASNRARERRRLLRKILAIQDELQVLEDQSQEMRDEQGNSQEDKAARAGRKACKRELKFILDDLQHQLRDMHKYSSREFQTTGGISDSSEATSGAHWTEDDFTGLRQPRKARHSPQKLLGNTMGAAHSVEAGRGTKHSASSTVDSAGMPEGLLRRKEMLEQGKRVAVKRHHGRRRRVDLPLKQSRMEVVRQLVDEAPGLSPEETLRMAENIPTRG